jgi:hypothetical protein
MLKFSIMKLVVVGSVMATPWQMVQEFNPNFRILHPVACVCTLIYEGVGLRNNCILLLPLHVSFFDHLQVEQI